MTTSAPTREPKKVSADSLVAEETVSANPLAAETRDVRAGANMYGAFSVETFCNAGSLSLTHDDTEGFLKYVEQFTPRNFWYKDAGVKIWAYYETYDNWQDTYGLDAVCVGYHCGHGGMDNNGVFYVPLGAAWAGNDCTATSNNMRLGNEHLRYLFWSTCLSLRVLGGHSPIRTWSAANLGLRMIFGFETVSWDDARYGSGFWDHWRRNETFSTAWMNSSWDIAHDQAPSVSANGSSAQEAQDRVFNERFFYPNQASTAWWWWRWYNVAGSLARETNRAVPDDPRIALLAPPSARSLSRISQRFDIDASSAQHSDGLTSVTDGERRLDVGDDGVVSASLAEPNRSNRTPLSRRDARSVAERAIRRYGLDAGTSLVLDRVVDLCEAGGTDNGDGERQGPFTTGTMVQYRQVINGLPVITPAAGSVRVTMDNDGTVTHVQSSIRDVEDLSDRARSTAPEPSPNGQPRTADASPSPEDALARAFSRQLRQLALDGRAPLGYSVVPGSTEIGYDISGSVAEVVAQRAVEIEFEQGLRKRYWVKARLFG